MESDAAETCRLMCFGVFQSTLSAWRVTKNIRLAKNHFVISIHTLRMESDQQRQCRDKRYKHISIHTLRMESDP